jgi:hypothetical protein
MDDRRDPREDEMKSIEVFVPQGESKFEEITMAERTADLNNKVVGFLWTQKANGDLLLDQIAKAMKEKFKLSGTLMRSKPYSTAGAPPEVLDELAARCDLVILAIAD